MTTKSKRIKAQPLTREEFDLLLERIAITTTELRREEADRDLAIQQVQTGYAPEIERLQIMIKADASLCEKYAEEHRADLLPGKAKSAETGLVKFGFRTGMPTLKPLSGWTWEKITAELVKHSFRKWLRVKPEPAKDLMLAAYQRRPERIEKVLKNLGCRVAQDESFYIEPKVDGAETVKAAR